jgi:hypothetical protein
MMDQLDPDIAGATDWDRLANSPKVAAFLHKFEIQTRLWPTLATTSDRTCVRLTEEPPF